MWWWSLLQFGVVCLVSGQESLSESLSIRFLQAIVFHFFSALVPTICPPLSQFRYDQYRKLSEPKRFQQYPFSTKDNQRLNQRETTSIFEYFSISGYISGYRCYYRSIRHNIYVTVGFQSFESVFSERHDNATNVSNDRSLCNLGQHSARSTRASVFVSLCEIREDTRDTIVFIYRCLILVTSCTLHRTHRVALAISCSLF